MLKNPHNLKARNSRTVHTTLARLSYWDKLFEELQLRVHGCLVILESWVYVEVTSCGRRVVKIVRWKEDTKLTLR